MKRVFSGIMIALLLTGTLFLAFNIQEFLQSFIAFAHGGNQLSNWAYEPPTIDGVVDPMEWRGINNTVEFTTSGGTSGTFYVMNDGLNLYVAVITNDPTLSKDGAGCDIVSIFFDNDHDGGGPELGDEIIGWTGFLSEGFQDCFSDGTYVRNRDTDFGGSSDGAAEAGNHGECNHFEFVHPLDTDDSSHDFSLSMNDTVGFAILLFVDGIDRGWWPSDDQSLWCDITVYEPVFSAWALETPLIDGKLTPAYEGHITPEWWYADSREFDLSCGAESHPACLYVMNDYINLYLALVIENEEFNSNDKVVFNFDDDNDGFKEIGDDQLWVEMDITFFGNENHGGRFQDGFFQSPSGAPSYFRDMDYGGALDGVGAAQFTAETPSTIASYVVEVAHPLDPMLYDNEGHDFYLPAPRVSGMDEVGVNVLYVDNSVEGGWPTLTWGDWSEMATIKLADPPSPPRLPWTDVSIAGIEITQAIQYFGDYPEGIDNSVPLVAGKSTVVRVYVDPGAAAGPTDVTVYLYATTHEGASLVETGVWSSCGPLKGRAVVQGSDLCPEPRSNENCTVNFLLPDYWVMQHGGLNLTAFVKTTNFLWEDYGDNWMSWRGFSITPTRSLRIGYYLIDYRPTAPNANPNIPNATKAAMMHQFFEKVTPMPDLLDPVQLSYIATHTWDGPNFTDPVTGEFIVENEAELLWDLRDLMDDLPPGVGYDQVCGLYADVACSVGISGGDDIIGVFVAHETRPWSFAHEIGHNYGFAGRHSWVDPDNPYNDVADRENSSQTCGYDTQGDWWDNEQARFPPALDVDDEPGNIVKVPVNHSSYPGGKYGALMSYTDEYRWISPYEWRVLMEAFHPLGAADLSAATSDMVQSSSPGLRISGVIYRNNTGSLKPVFQTSFTPYTGPTGPYVVELRGAPPAYPLLYSQSFDVSFESDVEEDPSPLERTQFRVNLPFITGAYSVYLWNGTILLDKITASANPPQVVVTYPNGGEIVGDSVNVTWAAADPDGDPLTFKLYYSSDNGTTWIPLATRITKTTTYRVDTSMLPGGSQWLIRVSASDGFYTSEDQSDGTFTVPNKGPQDVLAYVQTRVPNEPFLNSSSSRESFRAHFGDFLILKGSAYDPEDGSLNGTALTWASDINGTLGTGRVLTVMDLIPGIHNITLTATDSDGNNASKSFTVAVELRDIAVTDVTKTKTVVGQGFTLSINATVENQGNFPATFNVTVYANATGIKTQEAALASGNTTAIVFDWNTTGFSYGNYSINAYVEILPDETNTLNNLLVDGWVTVSIPGDINGDFTVDIYDAILLANAFNSNPSTSNWNANADINDDDAVDIYDAIILANHFNQHYP